MRGALRLSKHEAGDIGHHALVGKKSRLNQLLLHDHSRDSAGRLYSEVSA